MVLRQALQIEEIVDPASDPGSGLALALDRPETVKICSKRVWFEKCLVRKKYLFKKKIVVRQIFVIKK